VHPGGSGQTQSRNPCTDRNRRPGGSWRKPAHATTWSTSSTAQTRCLTEPQRRQQRTSQDHVSARTAEYQAPTSWSLQSSKTGASLRPVRLATKTVLSRFWAHTSARHDVEHPLHSPSHTSDWREYILAVQWGVAPASNHKLLRGERTPTQSRAHGPGRALRRIWANEIQDPFGPQEGTTKTQDRVSAQTADHQVPTSWSVQSSKS
jgi:hypothetical protein